MAGAHLPRCRQSVGCCMAIGIGGQAHAAAQLWLPKLDCVQVTQREPTKRKQIPDNALHLLSSSHAFEHLPFHGADDIRGIVPPLPPWLSVRISTSACPTAAAVESQRSVIHTHKGIGKCMMADVCHIMTHGHVFLASSRVYLLYFMTVHDSSRGTYT